jgi:hypothetical protein
MEAKFHYDQQIFEHKTITVPYLRQHHFNHYTILLCNVLEAFVSNKREITTWEKLSLTVYCIHTKSSHCF